ncbi:MAG: hypothetical protein KF689_04305 [Gemmatimonadaceae bacterium]|nr:hypothetical protein [Gemmatimonadaceae bacterium]MCW5825597.1 hypothetical protein [Gemmatimonadaceae bacterium]
MKKGTLVTIILALGFAGLLLYSTLAAQQVECSACVTFNGKTNCATASGKDEAEALTTVVNTACGTISAGMAESIQCSGMPPQRPVCRTR